MRILYTLLLVAAIGACSNYGTVVGQPPVDQPPATDVADAGSPETPDTGPVAQTDGGSGAQEDAAQPSDSGSGGNEDAAQPDDGGCPLDAGDEPDGKVTLCHLPPGKPSSSGCHTIRVGSPAADAHLRHGDYLGDCREGCR